MRARGGKRARHLWGREREREEKRDEDGEEEKHLDAEVSGWEKTMAGRGRQKVRE